MAHMNYDALAIGALAGFACLVAISVGLVVWIARKAYSVPPAGETRPDAAND